MYALLAFAARPEGSPVYYEQLAELASQLTNWNEAPSQAETHGLSPLLYVHLQAANIALPPDIKRQLQGLYLRHRHANQVRTQALGEILAAYQQAGIQVLLLKGAALAYLAYPQPGLRPMRDIDLLVETSRAWQAQRLLADLGFNAPAGGKDELPSKHLAAATRRIEGFLVSVEVHHNLFHDDYPVSMSLADLTTPPLPISLPQSLSAQTLGYEDMLWHLCHHIVNIAHPFRLIWLADIVGLAERFAAEIDWQRIERDYPRILATLSLFHAMTPLSESLLQQARVKIGRMPQGIGLEFQGWPRFSLAQQHAKGYARILYDTFFPSEWWLRLYYGVGTTRPIFWQRWLRHPHHILGFVARYLLSKVGHLK